LQSKIDFVLLISCVLCKNNWNKC